MTNPFSFIARWFNERRAERWFRKELAAHRMQCPEKDTVLCESAALKWTRTYFHLPDTWEAKK